LREREGKLSYTNVNLDWTQGKMSKWEAGKQLDNNNYLTK